MASGPATVRCTPNVLEFKLADARKVWCCSGLHGLFSTPLGKNRYVSTWVCTRIVTKRDLKPKSVSLNHLGFFCGYGVGQYTEAQSRPSSNNLTYVCTFSASLLSNYLEVVSGGRVCQSSGSGWA